ncbi:hypothetical protein ACH4FX_43090 [Streptomyces sp. NPDC018019]|uniref:hypothetical protein n=1 Tax=Streptomyces sp. NPDC018019 TaxID=3365030 RepID=UPI0037A520B5
MKGKNGKALANARAAAGSLNGQSLGNALRTTAESWTPALNGMHDRATASAASLRKSAEGNDVTPVHERDMAGGPARDPHPELRPQRSGSPFG